MSQKDKQVVAAVLGLIGLLVVARLLMVAFESENTPTRPRSASRPAPTTDPYTTFTTVRNDCGVCGTDSPVGGWEAADGRMLILSENGTFIADVDDGPALSGEWEVNGRQLCLTHSLGARSCFSYQQKVDAMKLDEGIYIRK